jgi:hypothetical protein
MKYPIWQYAFGWPVLVVFPLGLAWLCWPWDNHFVSYFWLIVLLAVLIAEIVNKLWSPRKETVSDNIRKHRINDPRRFWIMIVIWMLFAVTLSVHFMLKGV